MANPLCENGGMKNRNTCGVNRKNRVWRVPDEVIATFGTVTLVRKADGGHDLKGGTRHDQAAVKTWCRRFAPFVGFEGNIRRCTQFNVRRLSSRQASGPFTAGKMRLVVIAPPVTLSGIQFGAFYGFGRCKNQRSCRNCAIPVYRTRHVSLPVRMASQSREATGKRSTVIAYGPTPASTFSRNMTRPIGHCRRFGALPMSSAGA